MTKADLIAAIARDADISKSAAERAVNSFTHHVTKALARHDKLTLTGFGTFAVIRRKERKTPHPTLKEKVTIPAAWVPRFRPGKDLRASLDS